LTPVYNCSYVKIRHYTTFAIKSVIVFAPSHALSEIYWNSNESSAGTSGCSGVILLKIRTYQ